MTHAVAKFDVGGGAETTITRTQQKSSDHYVYALKSANQLLGHQELVTQQNTSFDMII